MAKKSTNSKVITPNHPYFDEIKGFRDLRAADKISRSIGVFFGVFGLIIAVLSVIGMTYIGSKSKLVPMMFMTDSHGGLVYSGVATDVLKITNPMIANQLKDYIVGLRQIPQDTDLKNEYMKKVKMMSTPDLFSNIVIPMVTERYTSNIGKTVKVKVRTVIPVGKNTWQIDWDEQISDLPPNKFKGSITFTLNPKIVDPAILLYDPLGIVVSDVNINQEVSQ